MNNLVSKEDMIALVEAIYDEKSIMQSMDDFDTGIMRENEATILIRQQIVRKKFQAMYGIPYDEATVTQRRRYVDAFGMSEGAKVVHQIQKFIGMFRGEFWPKYTEEHE